MNLLPAFGGIGGTEWLIILAIVVILFGASRIPELMRGMGVGIKEFKKGIKEGEEPKAEAKKQETSHGSH